MRDAQWISAQAAAKQLGVTLPTLYAYVSRGLIHSAPGNEQRRTRRYSSADVHHLIEQKTLRRDPARAATAALDWGLPVLESCLTLIADGGLWYRGQNALDLARNATFEEVAALLWTGERSDAATIRAATLPYRATLSVSSDGRVPPDGSMALAHIDLPLAPIQRWEIALTLAAAQDLAAFDSTRQIQTGARILRLLTDVLTTTDGEEGTVAARLARAWAGGAADAQRLIDAALILCADHELNISTFTARVVASGGAHLYLAVAGAMAAVQGFRHGGQTELVAALLREISPSGVGESSTASELARAGIAARLRRGEVIPGFGHRLYPDGDPRARTLLELLRAARPAAPALARASAVMAVGEEVLGRPPNIDFALVALAQTLELPPGAPLAIFALGRTAGWIAHAIEQAQTEQLLRPRAAYTGPLTSTTEL